MRPALFVFALVLGMSVGNFRPAFAEVPVANADPAQESVDAIASAYKRLREQQAYLRRIRDASGDEIARLNNIERITRDSITRMKGELGQIVADQPTFERLREQAVNVQTGVFEPIVDVFQVIIAQTPQNIADLIISGSEYGYSAYQMLDTYTDQRLIDGDARIDRLSETISKREKSLKEIGTQKADLGKLVDATLKAEGAASEQFWGEVGETLRRLDEETKRVNEIREQEVETQKPYYEAAKAEAVRRQEEARKQALRDQYWQQLTGGGMGGGGIGGGGIQITIGSGGTSVGFGDGSGGAGPSVACINLTEFCAWLRD